MSAEEGIKFNVDHLKEKLPADIDLKELLKLRELLYKEELVGAYKSGLGFGNVSIKYGSGFIITGSGTGTISSLDSSHLSYVTECSIERNSVKCVGESVASSESLAHASIYNSVDVSFVAHIHSKELWQKHMNILPTTADTIPYGTPEMGVAIGTLAKSEEGVVIVMGGHEEGLITFGNSVKEIMEQISSL